MNRTMTGSLAVAQPKATREGGSAEGILIAALICIATIALPNLAYARGGGGGGFHGAGGSGFHAGGGGFHAAALGGFHGGGLFHGAGVGGQAGGWQGARHDGRYGSYDAGWGYDPYVWSGDDLYNSDDVSGTSYASQYWYCGNPAGYYPYVRQCSVPWQAAPAD